jgi:hypothetical protein
MGLAAFGLAGEGGVGPCAGVVMMGRSMMIRPECTVTFFHSLFHFPSPISFLYFRIQLKFDFKFKPCDKLYPRINIQFEHIRNVMDLFIYNFTLSCIIFLSCFLYFISNSLKCTFGLNSNSYLIITFLSLLFYYFFSYTNFGPYNNLLNGKNYLYSFVFYVLLFILIY